MSGTFVQTLLGNYNSTKSCLCVGLDPDVDKLPSSYPQSIDGITDFLKKVIDLTSENCIAYKPNISFFEALGIDGLRCLQNICGYIPDNIPIIIDAKRGDIGNTSKMQAKFIFEHLGADATTLHPYMGIDSLEPFFSYTDKFNFVLGLTSNPSANDFETQTINGIPLYQKVLTKCAEWNAHYHNIGVVVGATQDDMKLARAIDPDLLFLIPGVGHQGGTYSNAYQNGKNDAGIAVINVGRSLLYPKNDAPLEKHIPLAITEILAS